MRYKVALINKLANIMINMKLKYLILITFLIYLKNYSQSSDHIVTSTYDTIYVDRIDLTDFKLKTKKSDQKKKYNFEDIISYYISKENKYYERTANQIEKKDLQELNRYDYKRLENLYLEDYVKRIKYKFIQRLTIGKIKLFCEEIKQTILGSGIPGSSNYVSTDYYEVKKYLISSNDSKLELINNKPKLRFIKNSLDLELNAEVYEILKIYLYGHSEITIKLDNLFVTKPIAKEKQIIDLINEYNILVKTNK
jgi:hypothetical protein